MIGINKNFEYIPKQKIIIIWQARAACSSIMKMYFKELNLLEDKYLKARTLVHKLRHSHSHKKSYIIKRKEALNDNDTKYVQFVVNPFRRAVSSYIHYMRSNYLGNIRENISFKEYIDNLKNNKYGPNIHHDKQYSFLAKEKNIDYIKMEKFTKIKDKFNKKYNLNFHLIEKQGHNNNLRKNNKVISKFIGDKKWSDIKDDFPNEYCHFYNHDLRREVISLYEEDFKTFNYTWKEFIENQ